MICLTIVPFQTLASFLSCLSGLFMLSCFFILVTMNCCLQFNLLICKLNQWRSKDPKIVATLLSLTHRKQIWFGFDSGQGNLVLLRMTLCFLAIAMLQFTDLGAMLDNNMTMSQHVLRVCPNCYFKPRLIRRLGKALSVESKLLLVHSLDYCNSVLMALPWSLIKQLQSMLNSDWLID